MFNGQTQRDPPTKVRLSSATSAVFIVALAFMLPREFSLEKSSPALLDWVTVEKRLPWGVILLMGGGFTLADATGKTGLSDYIVLQLEFLKVCRKCCHLDFKKYLQSLDPLLVSFIIAFVSTFLTEVASNTACANILVPILSQVLIQGGPLVTTFRFWLALNMKSCMLQSIFFSRVKPVWKNCTNWVHEVLYSFIENNWGPFL